jgi:hypothetical protein
MLNGGGGVDSVVLCHRGCPLERIVRSRRSWCTGLSRKYFILSISSLESLPSVRDLLAPRAPPEVAGPPPAMPETVVPPATAITEAPPAARPKPAVNTAHKRQISEAIPRNERLIARQARSELAEGDARGGSLGRCRRQALLSDAVAKRASLNSAVEGRNW